MANDDKIYEAYMGSMGEQFKDEVRNRIEWILESVGDRKNIIDAGCSQGITSILLAQKGKNVIGIDIQKESIDFALGLLNREYSDLKNNLRFICTPLEQYQSDKKFDCIVATEVLEHLKQPSDFLEKIEKLLDKDGKVVITVPFGVNNHPDHYTTFYMTSLVELLNCYFDVDDIVYLSNWMGCIAYKKDCVKSKFSIGLDEIKKQEEHFLIINKNLVNRNEHLVLNNKLLNEKYKSSLENYEKVKQWHNSSLQKYEKAREENNKIKEENENLNKIKIETTEQIFNIYKELNEQISILKESQKVIRKLELKNSYLNQENEIYKRKLSKITDTWYGNWGIKVYKLLKKIKRRLKR